MQDQHCEDCRFARNERPNLGLKRREYDCYGAPPAVIVLTTGRAAIGVLTPSPRPVVGAQDTICSLFKLRLNAPVSPARMAFAGNEHNSSVAPRAQSGFAAPAWAAPDNEETA